MKVRLAVSPERYEPLRAQLGAHGIEVDDSAELVLSEAGRFAETLAVRERAGGVRALLPVEEIVSIETLGREVVVYARGRCWQTGERLYRLAARLDPDRFLRVSQSTVVNRAAVREITPTLFMRFILTLSDGRRVDVTRTYYYLFKESFGI